MLSLIVPVYNAENTIIRCLESIVKMIKSFQCIIIDDGSTDSSSKFILSYISDKIGFEYYYQSNKGVSYARNFGLSKAKYDYVMFVDSDDFFSDSIDLSLIKNTDFDFLIFPNKKLEDSYLKNISRNTLCQNILNESKNINFRSPWGKIYLRSIIVNNNISFKNNIFIGEDFIFNLEYSKFVKKYFIINKVIYSYQINDLSLTRKFNIKYIENDKSFHKVVAIIVHDLDLSILYQKYLDKLLFQGYINCLKNFYFNKNNKMKYNIIKKNIKKDMQNEPYSKIFMKDFKYQPDNLKHKLLFFCLKFKFILLLKFFLRNN